MVRYCYIPSATQARLPQQSLAELDYQQSPADSELLLRHTLQAPTATHCSDMSLPLLLLAVAARLVSAHEHHEDAIPDGSAVSPDPIDTILWWHIFMMVLSFGIMFPLGMVLGMVRSRWHVPCQAIGTTAAITGWYAFCISRSFPVLTVAEGSSDMPTKAGNSHLISTRNSPQF